MKEMHFLDFLPLDKWSFSACLCSTSQIYVKVHLFSVNLAMRDFVLYCILTFFVRKGVTFACSQAFNRSDICSVLINHSHCFLINELIILYYTTTYYYKYHFKLLTQVEVLSIYFKFYFKYKYTSIPIELLIKKSIPKILSLIVLITIEGTSLFVPHVPHK